MDLPELAAIHDRYLTLACARQSLGDGRQSGLLLLRTDFDPALIVGASVAGVVSLCVDAEAEILRAGLRAGFCDFVVGHLDEALRILKNELRQHRVVSVGLTADPEACLGEIVERGLQPDFLSFGSPDSRAAQFLLERGALPIPEDSPDLHTAVVQWSITTEPTKSLRAIARIASGALDPYRADTPARRHWLNLSPAYLGRALGPRQCVRLTEKELAGFLPSLWSDFPAAEVTREGTRMPRA
ncbi:MAG TPA: hypothetical protein VHX37_14060 [Acidobacteriaceae bacterium]|jgi:hypothetical protein|nr:hypothetical protein [Acidobacteriaceae bacterium]